MAEDITQEQEQHNANIDQAYADYMVKKGFYIKNGDSYITNPSCPHSASKLTESWMIEKVKLFWTTTNKIPKWVKTPNKTSSR